MLLADTFVSYLCIFWSKRRKLCFSYGHFCKWLSIHGITFVEDQKGKQNFVTKSSQKKFLLKDLPKCLATRNSCCGSVGYEPNIVSVRMQVRSLASLSGLRIWHCSSNSTLELPYAEGAARIKKILATRSQHFALYSRYVLHDSYGADVEALSN